jgi:hypothetical protein
LDLKISTINARPTATSAAATAMTKKTKICPLKDLEDAGERHKNKIAAFSINSMDMKMISGLRRMSTPRTPIVNKMAERRCNNQQGLIHAPSLFSCFVRTIAPTMATNSKMDVTLERQKILIEQGMPLSRRFSTC